VPAADEAGDRGAATLARTRAMGAAGRRAKRSAYWRSNPMRKGGSRMRRLDRADRVAVLDGGRPHPLGNDRRWRVLQTRTRTFRRSAALGLVLLVRYRFRHNLVLVGSRDVGMLRARGRRLGLRAFMHRCDRRCMLNPQFPRGGRVARSIQGQAEAQQQTQWDGGQPHPITITNGSWTGGVCRFDAVASRT
jgi:hypothetical protein